MIEKKDAKAVKQPKGGKAAAKPAEPAKEEVPRERHNSGEAPKEQRKGVFMYIFNFILSSHACP